MVSPSTGSFCFGSFGLNRNISELGTPARDGKMVVGDHKAITGDSTVQIPEIDYGSIWDPLQRISGLTYHCLF